MYVQTESDKGPKNQNGLNLASVNPTAFVINLTEIVIDYV